MEFMIFCFFPGEWRVQFNFPMEGTGGDDQTRWWNGGEADNILLISKRVLFAGRELLKYYSE